MRVECISESLIESSTKEETAEENKRVPPKSSGGLFDEDEEEDDLFASVKVEKKAETKKGQFLSHLRSRSET